MNRRNFLGKHASEGNLSATGPWKSFRTLDPSATTTEFVVWNDTHEHDETLRKLHAATPRGDFLIWNGDTRQSPVLRVPQRTGRGDLLAHR